MDFDVLDSLEDIGYSALSDESKAKEALEVGPKSTAFTLLVEWFSKELQALCSLDSCVNAISDPNDSSSFLLEVSSFLKELRCPYKDLVTGPISQRLLDRKSRLVLVDYLCTELQAARLIRNRTKTKNIVDTKRKDSNSTMSLRMALKTLDIGPGGGDPLTLFPKIEEKIQLLMSTNTDLLSKTALEEDLSEQQWTFLSNLYVDFLSEYSIRREMLITRLDVTIQSFQWGEGSKGKEDAIFKAYGHKRAKLKKFPSVVVSDVLAARESIFSIEKTSSDELVKNTKSTLNHILIPPVPDRGGRAKEQRPPMEMPNWTKRNAGGGNRRGDNCGGRNPQRGHKKFKGPKGGDRSKGNFDSAGHY